MGWVHVPSSDRHFTFVVAVNWDVDRFASKVSAGIFADGRVHDELQRLRRYFQLPQLGYSDEPATITDMHGRILVWYLPDVLAIQRVVRYLKTGLHSFSSFVPNSSGRI